MPELRGAREMADKFVARLQVQRGNKNEQGESDAIGRRSRRHSEGDIGSDRDVPQTLLAFVMVM